MAELLRVLASLEEDLGLVPTPTRRLTTFNNSSSWECDVLFGPPWALSTHMVHWYIQAKRLCTFKIQVNSKRMYSYMKYNDSFVSNGLHVWFCFISWILMEPFWFGYLYPVIFSEWQKSLNDPVFRTYPTVKWYMSVF